MTDIAAKTETVYWYIRGPGFLHVGCTDPGLVTSTLLDIVHGNEYTVAASIAVYED